jgi:hypothetical protein
MQVTQPVSITTHTHTHTHTHVQVSFERKDGQLLDDDVPQFLKASSVYRVADQIPTPLCRCPATNRKHTIHFYKACMNTVSHIKYAYFLNARQQLHSKQSRKHLRGESNKIN